MWFTFTLSHSDYHVCSMYPYSYPQRMCFISHSLSCCWPTAALLSQTLRHGVICVLPVAVNYSSLDTISPHMVVGLFLSRVRLPGTAWATNELREPLLNVNSFRQLLKTRLFAECWTSAYSALEYKHYALYKSTYLLTYLLIKEINNQRMNEWMIHYQ